jgi:hypothetical protein
MYSIYHFFKSILNNKLSLLEIEKLEEFPFDSELLSCKNIGIFPDLAIKLNEDRHLFSGGELIELKDSKSYNVSSFNSTIPTRFKEISSIITSANSNIHKQMTEAGNNIHSLPLREVYYLVRGKSRGKTKVCLVSGAFFETISIENLISSSFQQVIEESLTDKNNELSAETKQILETIFSKQDNFSKVRNVDKASIKLRFRIMTEVKAEGNILNTKKYPEILDNTLNFLLPIYSKNDETEILNRMNIVFSNKEMNNISIKKLKHHFNGFFIVFQIPLDN